MSASTICTTAHLSVLDVLQAYQVLKRGGVKEENIIVMMQDDIAHNYMNPHPGKVYNKPNGQDVYEGVPLVCPHDPCIIIRQPSTLYIFW